MCEGIMKFILFIFNLVCALAGLVLIVLGALVKVKMSFVVNVLEENKLSIPAITVIVLGVIIFIIAFLGCCGAAKESHCMLISYSVILCAIFIIEVVIASLAFVYRKDVEDAFEKALTEVFEKPGDTVDEIQKTLQCCGLNGPESTSNRPSCCGKEEGACEIISAYKTGCSEKFKEFIQWSGNVLGGVAIGVAVIELIGIIFSCCMANEIKNQERRRGIA